MSNSSPESQPLSWRDPDGFVCRRDGTIYRAVHPDRERRTRDLLGSSWMQALIAEGRIPGTMPAEAAPAIDGAADWFWLRHETLPFPCYPHEITALQLYDSALLTLDIAAVAARNGWQLKDASAWNVLHSRGRAVFVDLLSFEALPPSGTWIAYGQFARHFVLPLLLHRKAGTTPDEVFQIYRDGIPPERAYAMLRGTGLVSPGALEFVVLPTLLAPAGGRLIADQRTHRPRAVNAEMAHELFQTTLRRLRRAVEKLRPDQTATRSVWKKYEEERAHYTDADLAVKTKFLRESLGDSVSVLDLGCNAGEFSLVAADAGKTVVAADFDHPALSRLYERIRTQPAAVTPLLLNIGRPTPAVGWQNREPASFLQRATGEFDCILALGLIHHLLVSERASLAMIGRLLAELRPKRVIIEWVDPKDPKFQQVAGLNADLYAALDAAAFEREMGAHFALTRKIELPCGTRVMYSWAR